MVNEYDNAHIIMYVHMHAGPHHCVRTWWEGPTRTGGRRIHIGPGGWGVGSTATT